MFKNLYRWLWIVSICTLFISAPLISAQELTSPLYLLANGDVYRWNGDQQAPQKLTDWTSNDGYIHVLAQSPDGTRLAYMAYPQMTLSGLGEGNLDVDLPSDIWIMNYDTESGVRIARQPDGATYTDDSNPAVRSKPAWSPDSTQIAWTEYTRPNLNDTRVMIYDLTTGSTTTLIPHLPLPLNEGGASSLGDILWLTDQLIVHVPPGRDRPTESFLIYSEKGNLSHTFDLIHTFQPSDLPSPITTLPITYRGQDYVALFDQKTRAWKLLDPRQGTLENALAWPELALADPSSKSLHLSLMNTYMNWPQIAMQARDVHGIPVSSAITIDLNGLALSPDGDSFAFHPITTSSNDFSITLWKDGGVWYVPEVGPNLSASSFVWGSGVWHIPGACLTGQPARLAIGEKGRVIAGTKPSNLRLGPSRQAQVVNSIPEKGLFTILDGPECNDDINWWRVDFGGNGGWIAEGQDDEYYVEPVP